ncbi:hypothetical protein M2351_005354 [Azospirillum canadense]|nr:hypothetical protein [Azospirillum canadense]
MPPRLLITVSQPGVIGANQLAKRLNELKNNSQISDWHPGRWTDRKTMTPWEIIFDSDKDALFAKMEWPDATLPRP